MQFSPRSSTIPLVFVGVSFIEKFQVIRPERGRQRRMGWKIRHFLALSVNISKTVVLWPKLLVND